MTETIEMNDELKDINLSLASVRVLMERITAAKQLVSRKPQHKLAKHEFWYDHHTATELDTKYRKMETLAKALMDRKREILQEAENGL